MNNKWQIALTIVFPGLGQIIQGRWRIGIPMVIFNGICLYVLWFVLMPVSLGIILHDLRTANGTIESKAEPKESRTKPKFPVSIYESEPTDKLPPKL